jgi:hypothetical protein
MSRCAEQAQSSTLRRINSLQPFRLTCASSIMLLETKILEVVLGLHHMNPYPLVHSIKR